MEGTNPAPRRASQVAAVVCLSLSAAVLWAPPAVTQPADKVEVETAVEAWYHTADEGAAPAPLPVVPDPVNPYGDNTLHVSIAGGQEQARTYIALDLGDLPVTFELEEGTLTLPIDPGGATLTPEAARVQVCLSDLPAKSEEGSFEEPPKPDCKTNAPANYRQKPYPQLVADITDFGADLAFSGVAIVPSDRAVEKQDTWHVTFYGKKSEAEGAHPITAALTILPAEDPFADDSFEVPVPTGGGVPSSGGSTGGDSSIDIPNSSLGPSLDAGSDSETTAEAPAETGDAPVEAAAPELELTSEVAPAYTIVWALPLLLLALSFYLGSALTSEVVVRGRR